MLRDCEWCRAEGSGCWCVDGRGHQARGACPRRPLARRGRSAPSAASPKAPLYSSPNWAEAHSSWRPEQAAAPEPREEGAVPTLRRLPAHFLALQWGGCVTRAGGDASSITRPGHGAAVIKKKKGAFVALSTRRKPRQTHSPTAGPSTFAGAEGSLWPVASVPQRGQTLSHARSLFAERPREDESMGWHLRHVALSAASPHPRSFADGPGTSWKEKRGKTQNQHSWRERFPETPTPVGDADAPRGGRVRGGH